MKYGIIVGRFQPFHKGHLLAIKKASKKYEKIGVGIFTPRLEDIKNKKRIFDMDMFSKKSNPFSFITVKKMVEKTLKEEKIDNVEIFKFYPPNLYTKNKFESNLPFPSSEIEFFVAVKNKRDRMRNKMIKKLGYNYVEHKVFGNNGFDYSAGMIRKSIFSGDNKWKQLVPGPVKEIILESFSK